jgi:hypothetical protein
MHAGDIKHALRQKPANQEHSVPGCSCYEHGDPDRYRIETLHSLRQVYFDASRHGQRLQSDIANALEELT